MNKASTWLLYGVSFSTNAIILIFEITGGRLLAPYLGTSVEIWAGLIAIVLGGMAVGYWLGGYIGDRNASPTVITSFLIAAGAAALITWSIRDLAPTIFATLNTPLTINALLVATVLFMPTVILLAAVSPLIAKNLIKTLEQSARTVGTLNAVGTIGSIVGAVITGLILIPFFGVNSILLGTALTIFAIALCVQGSRFFKSSFFLLLTIGLSLLLNSFPTRADIAYADISTAYNRIWINEYPIQDRSVIRTISMDPFGTQCALFRDENGVFNETFLIFPYIKAFDIVGKDALQGRPAPRALFLGGCNYSYPRAFLHAYPDGVADVVEIDPGMTQAAKDYFGFLPENFPALSIFHQDARVFLNNTHEPYDIIFMDTFGSQSGIPFHLTTKETFERLHTHLKDNGTLVVNLIGAPEGAYSDFASSLLETVRSVFPYASLYPLGETPTQLQNLLIVASTSQEPKQSFLSPAYPELPFSKVEPSGHATVLVDDYAPVEALQNLQR